MKKIICLLMIGTALSCSSGSDKAYEKAIADNVQTSKNGSYVDMKFNIIELNEMQKITVADSLKLLNEEQEKFKEEWINRNKKTIETYQQKLEKEKTGSIRSKSMIELYEKTIAASQNRIDSLENTTSVEAKKYENMDTTKVLAVLVRCKYSVVPPFVGNEVQETYDFLLNAEGTKVISRKKVKDQG